MKRVFQTSDNLTFETEQAALNHEEGLKKSQSRACGKIQTWLYCFNFVEET